MTAEFVDSTGASYRLTKYHVREPITGVWVIDLALLDEAAKLTGSGELRLHGAIWKGTIDPAYSGNWGGRGSLRLVAGGGGWGKTLARSGYHSDSGVKGKTVATEAANGCGEVLGSFAGETRLGADYARPTGLASVTLEDTCGEAQWWVDRAGLTHVGTRSAAAFAGRLLNWDTSSNVATLDTEDLSILEVGATLTDDRLSGTQTIRELEIIGEGSSVRALAWCGTAGSPAGRIPRLLAALVQRLTEGPLWGKYKFRVVSMASDGRANLQAVNKSAGIPDLLPVTQWPGVAGADAVLTEGAEVLVEFIEGDRAQPIVTHFTPKGKNGFVPVSLSLCGGQRAVATVGSMVDIFMSIGVPIPFNGMVGVGPAASPIVGTFTLQTPVKGVISNGSAKVKA